jgi:hypothetical protein
MTGVVAYYAWLAAAIMSVKPWRKRFFTHGGPGKKFRIAAFDLETTALDGDVIFATAMTEDMEDAVCFSGDDIIADIFEFMCCHRDFVWFAHNASFDWRYVLDYLRTRDDLFCQFGLRSDNALFSVSVIFGDGSAPLKMRDSYAIWPHTLRQLAFSFCPEFPKGNIDFRRETFDPHKRSHVDYAKRDVEILVRGLRRFDTIIEEKYGVHLSATVAGTALRAWERMLDRADYYHNPVKHEPFIRAGYFGGLVFLTRSDKIENREVKTYDRNSSYPACMRQDGVPYGHVMRSRRIISDKPGLYEITIGAPDNLQVPIIPKRIAGGRNSHIQWPRGIFRTHATGAEIEFALVHGYRLFDVHDGLVWSELVFPFEDFIARAEIIRAAFKKRTEETVAKLIQNSLYGKFCAKRERRRLISAAEIDDTTEGFEPWDEGGHYYVKREHADDMMVLPQWGVFITANARIALLRKVYEEIGVENVIYGDTDSITCLTGMSTGTAYGEWKHEKTWIKFRAIAPKVYAGQLEDGTWAGAVKGIPTGDRDGDYEKWWRNQLVFKQLYETGEVREQIDTLPSLMVAMKTGKSKLKTTFRRSTDIANSASWEIGEGEIVRPREAIG